MIELPKSQKKIARELIDLGLHRECKSFGMKIAKFANSKEWETQNPHELYLKLYKKVASFDKHLGSRYDGMSGSRYFITVWGLFHDGVLTEEDISRFDDDVKNRLLALKTSFEE